MKRKRNKAKRIHAWQRRTPRALQAAADRPTRKSISPSEDGAVATLVDYSSTFASPHHVQLDRIPTAVPASPSYCARHAGIVQQKSEHEAITASSRALGSERGAERASTASGSSGSSKSRSSEKRMPQSCAIEQSRGAGKREQGFERNRGRSDRPPAGSRRQLLLVQLMLPRLANPYSGQTDFAQLARDVPSFAALFVALLALPLHVKRILILLLSRHSSLQDGHSGRLTIDFQDDAAVRCASFPFY